MIKVKENIVNCMCPMCLNIQLVSESEADKVIHCKHCHYNYHHEPNRMVTASCPKCHSKKNVQQDDVDKAIHCDVCYFNYNVEKGVIINEFFKRS